MLKKITICFFAILFVLILLAQSSFNVKFVCIAEQETASFFLNLEEQSEIDNIEETSNMFFEHVLIQRYKPCLAATSGEYLSVKKNTHDFSFGLTSHSPPLIYS